MKTVQISLNSIDKVKSFGIDAVEMTAGGWGARKHCNTAELLADAGKREAFMMELEKRGIRSELLREEPFTTAQDSIEFKMHLMIWEKGILNRKARIETWEDQ